jgi:beta-N-acetylhexosaminidase
VSRLFPRLLRGGSFLAGWILVGSCVTASADAPRPPASTLATSAVAASCLSVTQLAELPTRRLARLAIVDPVDEGDVTALSAEVTSGIGGVILLGNDAPAALGAQLHRLLALAPKGRVPLVMVDEEGGSVQRLVARLGEVPSARTMGATMSPAAIEVLARGVGTRLRSLAITMDLAPVLDLDAAPGPNATDADGTRSFSANAAKAAADGLAFAKGLLSAGVVPVLKHFPGLGGASGNTDLGPAATKAYHGVRTAGVRPFAAAIRAQAPAVMVANATVPGLTTKPASLSRSVITTLLRNKLGFSGLVLTDSLTVPSITAAGYSLPEAAVAALRAGADEVLFNATPAGVATDNAAIVASVLRAVARHKLTRARLVQAAGDAESAKTMVGACGA